MTVRERADRPNRVRTPGHDGKPFVGNHFEALQEAASWSWFGALDASVVRLVPKGTKAQRRVVFDDMIDERDTDDAINAVYDVIQDLDGKRVRITVEVLPDEGGGT